MACKIIITVFRFFYFYINTEFLKILHSVVDDAPQKRTEKQIIFQTQCMEVVVLEKVASPRCAFRCCDGTSPHDHLGDTSKADQTVFSNSLGKTLLSLS